MSSLTLTIDTYLCNGCGSCVEICPKVFKLDDITEKAVLIADEPEISETVRKAIAYCPEKCIELS